MRFVLIIMILTLLSCRKEASQEPVSQDKSDTSTVVSPKDSDPDSTTLSESTDLESGDEDITGAALQDTGIQQELVEQIEVPAAPSQLGQNLKGWKPPKSTKKKTAPANKSTIKFPKDMWVIADSLTIRSGPGTEFAKSGTLLYGVKVSVVAVEKKFAKLGEKQFVAEKYLTDRKAKFLPIKKK